MSISSHDCTPSKAARWAGHILSTLIILFMLMDAGMKFVKPDFVVKGTSDLGFKESVIVPLGVTLLVCTVLYAIPRTAVLGAILLTGYLGGAVATHVHHEDPLFTHILSPVYFGIVTWLGLYLRDPRLRALMPFRCCGSA